MIGVAFVIITIHVSSETNVTYSCIVLHRILIIGVHLRPNAKVVGIYIYITMDVIVQHVFILINNTKYHVIDGKRGSLNDTNYYNIYI